MFYFSSLAQHCSLILTVAVCEKICNSTIVTETGVAKRGLPGKGVSPVGDILCKKARSRNFSYYGNHVVLLHDLPVTMETRLVLATQSSKYISYCKHFDQLQTLKC
ncbi:hypothetical protein CDAR_567001 [Caerostris darwini]|uniref:Uncharacterized protein n=1 Tax=Caerostris darwini TaxID=1538125 RepID=A0AAV4MBM6_9ARAC|nr:hypothetical protein CDAR_566951 [Caerostris darwini]GIX69877.1 hypothetical protein CDAR_567001 [Caerostris darwini]